MPKANYRKGDLVQFQWGIRFVQGVVMEDRGPIGVKGRHLYRVEFRPQSESIFQVELPAEEMQPVSTNGAKG